MSKTSTRSSRRRIAVAILVFALLIAVVGPANAVETPSVSGVVTDLLGRVLSGVELLWARQPVEGLKPAATALTDGAGRFEVHKLKPGKYRVAALKDGYRTIIGQIDTSRESRLNLVMQPVGADVPSTRVDDPGWALRVPRRGMLHELDPSTLAWPAADATAPWTVKLDQLFSAGTGNFESDTSEVSVRPSETTLEMTTVFSDRSRLRVRGRREQIRGTAGLAEHAIAEQSGETVNLDFAYATSPGSKISLTASFTQSEYELASTEVTGTEWRQQHETQAYAARWTHRLEAGSRLDVGVRYLDTGIESPSSFGANPVALNNAGRFSRTVAADGAFQATLGQTHSVRVEMHAVMFEQPVDRRLETSSLRGSESSRWSVRGEVQDRWRLRAPWSLIYGAGYKQSFLGSRTAMLAPRVGAGYSVGALQGSALFSYHAVTSADGEGRRGDGPDFRPRGRFGYAADLVLPLAADVLLSGAMSYEPVQLDHYGYGYGSAMQGDHPLFLTDGNSSLREYRLKLVERRGPSRTYFEIADGRCSGSVAPLMPFESPVVTDQDRVVHFRTGRVGVHLEHLGTDLRLEYQLVDSARRGAGELVAEAVQESVEIRLRQDVSIESWPGSWQLLVALRMGSVRSAELEGAGDYAGVESLDALNRRVSAGVSVLF